MKKVETTDIDPGATSANVYIRGHLYLDGNEIGDEGATAIGKALERVEDRAGPQGTQVTNASALPRKQALLKASTCLSIGPCVCRLGDSTKAKLQEVAAKRKNVKLEL